ncbi:uncharacterized protein LOC129218365 [Uloborus diversus]|uniref:uncharacterized protein LOC129218365 n=1 Tax=Uloborus diversus TaxID=327109 RepID=UPI00240A2CDA|nr:uncharacterized protein LOC129218365 [Uloborus diversus]
MDSNNEFVIHNQMIGVPQGSCSGPFLWSLIAEDILHTSMPRGVFIQAFADDFVIGVVKETIKSMGDEANSALIQFKKWADYYNLKVSTDKSSLLLFRRKTKNQTIKYGTEKIKRVRTLKYLGIILDENLSFLPHIQHLKTKSTNYLQHLRRLAGKYWGYNIRFRARLYDSVFLRIIAYASPIWASNPTTRLNLNLLKLQRPLLLHLTGAYATTANSSLQIITGIPPLDIQISYEVKMGTLLRLNKDVVTCFGILRASSFEKKIKTILFHPSVSLTSSLQINSSNLENSSTNIYSFRYFTDGSKTKQATTAAFLILNNTTPTDETTFLLNVSNSIFQAEALAIKEAIDHAVTHNNLPSIMYSDSQSVIKSIGNLNPTNSLIAEIQQQLINHDNIKISWIKGHSTSAGNNRADFLANQTANGLLVPTKQHPLPFPRSFAKHKLLQDLRTDWQERWEQDITGRLIYKIRPKVKLTPLNLNRHEIFFLYWPWPFPFILEKIPY